METDGKIKQMSPEHRYGQLLEAMKDGRRVETAETSQMPQITVAPAKGAF